MATHNLQDIITDFSYLEDWEDRYRYVIELGQKLEDLPDELRTPDNKVQGCASQVWLATQLNKTDNSNSPVLTFIGDSDSTLVRGLISILLSAYSGKSAEDIIQIDASKILSDLDLQDHITPQRSNGFSAMAKRIRADAMTALS